LLQAERYHQFHNGIGKMFPLVRAAAGVVYY
jgi:hypothetical protein